MGRIDVYDVEIFPNCFTLTAVSIEDENDVLQFVVHDSRNDINDLVDYLSDPELRMIGYNNIRFDYPIIHPIVVFPERFRVKSAREITRMLYEIGQEYISAQNTNTRTRTVTPIIPQRDVFLIWHYDNVARATSLKWIQCAIGWKNVEDMPFHHTHWIEPGEITDVLSYNLNDTLSTRAFYLKKETQEKIDIRYELSDKFNIPMYNYNDPKIGETIIAIKMAEKLGVGMYDVKGMLNYPLPVKVKECLLPSISFKTKGFNRVLSLFNNMIVDPEETRKKEKDDKRFEVVYDGLIYHFGLGGIHAARDGGVIGKTKKKTGCTFHNVDSVDVTGYYPNMVISNNWSPSHLPGFIDVYRDDVVRERDKYPKGTAINTGLKLSSNGVFGKSNSKWSFLRDLKFFLQITINGQLLLAMVCEEITESGAGKILMANTDGIEVQVYNEPLYKQLLDNWQLKHGLKFEYVKYKTLAIRDVNNYIAVKTDGKTKEKGDYEVEKELHKDHSMKIVRKAVREYLLNGTSPKDYIENAREIGDFLLMVRAKTGSIFKNEIIPDTNDIVSIEMPKTIRYYMSRSGVCLMKKTDKKTEKLHKKGVVTIFNKWEDKPFEEYDVDLNFYIRKANELVAGIIQPQLLNL